MIWETARLAKALFTFKSSVLPKLLLADTMPLPALPEPDVSKMM